MRVFFLARLGGRSIFALGSIFGFVLSLFYLGSSIFGLGSILGLILNIFCLGSVLGLC